MVAVMGGLARAASGLPWSCFTGVAVLSDDVGKTLQCGRG